MPTKEEIREARRELLRNVCALILPDNPSSSHWSPAQVKKALSQGYFLLFGWLNELEDKVGVIEIGDFVESIDYDTEEQTFTINYSNGTTDTIEVGTGNANIYYDDTLPQNTAKLKSGDLYFDEQSE